MRRNIVILTLTAITAIGATISAQPNLVVRPDTIGWPASVDERKTRVDTLWLINTGDQILNVHAITAIADSTNPPGPSWLSVSTSGPLDIAARDSTFVRIYSHGDPFYAGSYIGMRGGVRVISSAPSPQDTLFCYVNIFVVRCCIGKRGNVNGRGIVDLSDLSVLVASLTGAAIDCGWCCWEAWNINGVGIVDLSDLSCLVSYLTGGGCIPALCP